MEEDFYLSSLMVSKLCHDLIGSASALSFSFGLLKEEDTNNQEAMNLAFQSSEVLINRLKYFRIAFGSSYLGAESSVEDNIKNLIFDLYKEKDIRIQWSADAKQILQGFLYGANIKLFLNIFLLVFYSIPSKNATVSLVVAKIDEAKIAIMLKVSGYTVYLKEPILKILNKDADAEKINPSNVHIYFIKFLLKKLNSTLEINNDSESLKLAFSLKKN